ncbi:MAG: hypothetical protein ACK4L7_04925 [Flavobacteriales bacterium]
MFGDIRREPPTAHDETAIIKLNDREQDISLRGGFSVSPPPDFLALRIGAHGETIEVAAGIGLAHQVEAAILRTPHAETVPLLAGYAQVAGEDRVAFGIEDHE